MPQSSDVISHWHYSVEDLSASPQEYYAALEKAFEEKAVKELKVARSFVNEAGLLSAQREYLSVRYGRFMFEICGAPFGKDFFFSWWLTRRTPSSAALWALVGLAGLPLSVLYVVTRYGMFHGTMFGLVALGIGGLVVAHLATSGGGGIEDAILALPILGPLYQRLVRPSTYYSEDTRLMFEDTVHRTVLDVVGGTLSLNKLPAIPQDQAKPKSRSALG